MGWRRERRKKRRQQLLATRGKYGCSTIRYWEVGIQIILMKLLFFLNELTIFVLKATAIPSDTTMKSLVQGIA